VVGQQIAHYQVQALLGEGRIGNVFQAIDLEDFSLVAIKVIHLHLMQEAGMRRRFLQEVNAIPRLEHPSIVKVHEAGIDTDHNLLYLTMDYLTGRSLNAYLRQLQFNNQQLDLGDALIIMAQIAEALGYAHQKGLIHRDIRPAVILFRTDDKPEESHNLPGRAVISDFALESILEAETEPFAPALPYQAPELFLDRPADGRSDIYSLGILLYQLTTGRLPFSATTLAEAARQHPYQDPPSPRSLRPEMPLALENAILKAMAKKPEARFQTGAEMAAALRNLAETLPARMSGTAVDADMYDVKTTAVPPLVALSSQWSDDQDHVMITRETPHSLKRQIITLGRSESNDVVLADTSVTRQHAQMERTGSGWQIRDLGSQNGTYLDEKPLLPDIPEEWEPHQTLRIGPFFLHLQPGKGVQLQKRPFAAAITPTELSVLPGNSAAITLTLVNQGTAVDEFSVSIERLPDGWVTLPAAPLRLRPDERTTITIPFQPPLAADVALGATRFLLVIRAAGHPEERLAVPGMLHVLPPANVFEANLAPTHLNKAGQSFLTLRNGSLHEQTFTVSGHNEDDGLRFSVWRLRETAPSSSQQAVSKNGAGKRPAANLGALNKLPLTRRLASYPRRAMMQLENGPRQALNRMMPGLGGMMPRLKLSPPRSKPTPGASTSSANNAQSKSMPTVDRTAYEEVVFPGNLATQVAIPAGQEEVIRLGLTPEKRPFFGRSAQILPFTITISAPGCESQSLGGEVQVKPHLRFNPAILIALFMALCLCLSGAAALSVWRSSTLAAILNTPADIDNDGLSNLAEVYVYHTDPNRADTDGDTLLDGDEIAQNTDPLKRDTDEDGLDDAQELLWHTNPRYSDSDGDNLADGLEIQLLKSDPLISNTLTITIPSLATPRRLPSPTPTQTPTPAPTIPPSDYTLTLGSLSGEDGYVMSDPSLGRAPIVDDDFLLVGEGDSNSRQIKAFLSFDTSTIPAEAIILSARLQLRRNAISGQPENLGEIHIDMAVPNGFANNWALEGDDFSGFAAQNNVMTIRNFYEAEWLEIPLSELGIEALNRNGRSQFRLYFTLPNNGDAIEDRLSFFAADVADSSLHPQLILQYELP